MAEHGFSQCRACKLIELDPKTVLAGVPQEVLLGDARALVERHDPFTREVRFNERLQAFACYWSFRPRTCAPYRTRTKGKDERGVGYVKRNAIAGHGFVSWAVLEAHLAWWMILLSTRATTCAGISQRGGQAPRSPAH